MEVLRSYWYSITRLTSLALGQKEFVNMLPLVCNDAVALFFMFDLSRKATLCAHRLEA